MVGTAVKPNCFRKRSSVCAIAVSSGFLGDIIGYGTGGFSTNIVELQEGTFPRSLAVSDFNRDGDLDIVLSNTSQQSMSILLGDGTGGFSAPNNFGVRGVEMSVGDFNGDGVPDLAVTGSDISIYLGIAVAVGP